MSRQEHFAARIAEQRVSKLLKATNATGYKQSFLRTIYRYEGSFLSTLPDVAFSYSYGLTQIVLYRWVMAPQVTADSNRMGFGQYVPLLLLLLPILAAGETYYGERSVSAKYSAS